VRPRSLLESDLLEIEPRVVRSIQEQKWAPTLERMTTTLTSRFWSMVVMALGNLEKKSRERELQRERERDADGKKKEEKSKETIKNECIREQCNSTLFTNG
jgi:hypothetical protein